MRSMAVRSVRQSSEPLAQGGHPVRGSVSPEEFIPIIELSKYCWPSGESRLPLIFIHSASCGFVLFSCSSCSVAISAAVLILKSAGGAGLAFAKVFNSARPALSPCRVL